jgi:hypothetical protein
MITLKSFGKSRPEGTLFKLMGFLVCADKCLTA